MIEQLIRAYDFGLTYTEALVQDIPVPDEATSGGPGLENSPLFLVGHLVTGAGLTAASFHGNNTVDKSIRDAFERKGPNDERLPDSSITKYSVRQLMDELAKQHSMVKQGIRSCSTEKWNSAKQWRLGQYFPTFADATWFMCVTHEAIHLGQLAAWRRWFGLPPAMAGL